MTRHTIRVYNRPRALTAAEIDAVIAQGGNLIAQRNAAISAALEEQRIKLEDERLASFWGRDAYYAWKAKQPNTSR